MKPSGRTFLKNGRDGAFGDKLFLADALCFVKQLLRPAKVACFSQCAARHIGDRWVAMRLRVMHTPSLRQGVAAPIRSIHSTTPPADGMNGTQRSLRPQPRKKM